MSLRLPAPTVVEMNATAEFEGVDSVNWLVTVSCSRATRRQANLPLRATIDASSSAEPCRVTQRDRDFLKASQTGTSILG